MNKQYTTIITVIIGLAIMGAIGMHYLKLNTQNQPIKEVVTQETSIPGVTTPLNFCYEREKKSTQGIDKTWLKLTIFGNKATGELQNLPAETDSKTGTFDGTVGPVDKIMMARVADVWWDAHAEGTEVKEQQQIIFGEGSASIGFGEMKDRGDGVFVYKDITKLTRIDLNEVGCDVLDDKIIVEKYIRENIATIAPKKPVLGGTWYVVSLDLSTQAKSGTVVYEDGHIQEKSNFTYSRVGDHVEVVFIN